MGLNSGSSSSFCLPKTHRFTTSRATPPLKPNLALLEKVMGGVLRDDLIEKMLPLILDRIKSSSDKSFRELVNELGYKSTGSITSYFKNKNPSFSKACQLLSSLGYEVTISPKS